MGSPVTGEAQQARHAPNKLKEWGFSSGPGETRTVAVCTTKKLRMSMQTMLYIGRQIHQGVTQGVPSPSGGKYEYYTFNKSMIITTFYYNIFAQ